MNTSIPKNIKRLQQQAGLTQEQLAEKLFVTRQTVSLWENGRTQPDIQALERIAECFGGLSVCVWTYTTGYDCVSALGFVVSWFFFPWLFCFCGYCVGESIIAAWKGTRPL